MDKAVNIRSGLWFFIIAAIICVWCSYFGYSATVENSFDTSFFNKFGSALSAITTAYLLLIFMPLPIEQHWTDKIRLGIVLTIGAVVMGIFCWPLIAPHAERETVSFFCSCISVTDALIVILGAFATGAAAYFLGYPNGRYTALAAVPMGVGIWALRSGTISNLLTYNNSPEQHRLVYMSLRWEGIFWFLVIAAGYAGVKTAAILCKDTAKSEEPAKKKQPAGDLALPLVITAAIAWLLTNILAQSPKIMTTGNGIIHAQPRQAQIAFALLAAFGVAGYLVKRYMNVRIEIPVISTVLVSLGAAIFSGRDSILEFSKNIPTSIFLHPISAILPVQMIAFGTLGVLIGYGIAILSHHKKKLLDADQAVKQ
ncbi:MAG: hypothetical protein ACIAQZ_16530 [Sedimentisphaeraceae bacterium JB056]